jgi:tRNA pseudouridine13 synthase
MQLYMTDSLRTDHWHYLHSKPQVSGILKDQVEDFIVRERLGYEPCGEGEHIYLWVRKQGLNTAFVAEQIAKFCQLPLRAVTYAGRKDKYAITEQWFSVHKPGLAEYDWNAFALTGVEVLKALRHNKKLRVGVLKGNQFELVVRNLSGIEGLQQRLELIAAKGVANYFGGQRFGDTKHHQQDGNLALAQAMIAGEPIRNRNKRSMAISALRAWLFNQFVSERIACQCFTKALNGDLMILSGSASFFCAEQIDQQIEQRLQSGDIKISAPMWGEGQLGTQGEAHSFESRIAADNIAVAEALASLGLKQERRAIGLLPQNMCWDITQQKLKISFELPAGAFATSVLREVVNAQAPLENE